MDKVRIYQLARELRIEAKRVMEEARRMGCNVAIPSNSLPAEIAQKIREKYSKRSTGSGEGSVG